MLTNSAKPMNNFILAALLFIILAFVQDGAQVTNANHVGEIMPSGAAAEAGSKENDEVVSMDGEEIHSWNDPTTVITKNPDKTLDLKIEREGQVQSVDVTSKPVESNGEKAGQLGTEAPMNIGFMDKITGGTRQVFSGSLEIFKALGPLLTSFSLDKLGGPVMMYQLSSEAASQGVATATNSMALFSIDLGIVNLPPIPALDGGKLVLNIFEGIRGKSLSQEKEGILILAGFGFLTSLMVLVTWNDTQRFFF